MSVSTMLAHLSRRFPKIYQCAAVLRDPPITFSGWGMTTTTSPPWSSQNSSDIAAFEATDALVKKAVASGRIRLSQFAGQDVARVIDILKWRHYIVYWTAAHAVRSAGGDTGRLVECGVCDGMSVYYAMGAAKNAGMPFHAWLYDAWASMKPERLLAGEQHHAGDYHYLNVEQTKINLSDFAGHTTFNQGFIPDSFATADNPDDLCWLHIDLNSALATSGALAFLYDRMRPGAVILFDDYAHRGYGDTRTAVDRFFDGKDVSVLQVPTGQAIAFKR